MQKLNDLYDQYRHAFKLQMQALRLLDALSDIDNGTNPRIIHARRRAFRRWDVRERRATRLYETWFNYRKLLSSAKPTLETLVRINELNPIPGSSLIEGEYQAVLESDKQACTLASCGFCSCDQCSSFPLDFFNDSGDTFAAPPVSASGLANPVFADSCEDGKAGQGEHPTTGRPGACTACGQPCDALSLSRLCPDCADAHAIQEEDPAHPSSMYQCPNFRPLSAGRFCACDSCNPVPA